MYTQLNKKPEGSPSPFTIDDSKKPEVSPIKVIPFEEIERLEEEKVRKGEKLSRFGPLVISEEEKHKKKMSEVRELGLKMKEECKAKGIKKLTPEESADRYKPVDFTIGDTITERTLNEIVEERSKYSVVLQKEKYDEQINRVDWHYVFLTKILNEEIYFHQCKVKQLQHDLNYLMIKHNDLKKDIDTAKKSKELEDLMFK